MKPSLPALGSRSSRASTPLVRPEGPRDVDAVRQIHSAAFGTATDALTSEARLVDDLRSRESWIPALSLVAEVDGAVVGHALATRGRLERDGSPLPARAIGIAPVGVRPDVQHRRVGSSLVRALLDRARDLGEEVVCVLGSSAYYGRFGFLPGSSLGVAPPVTEWAPHFHAMLLVPARPDHGPCTFHYDPAFDHTV